MRPSVFNIIPQVVPLAFLIIASITAPTITKLYLAKDSNDVTYGIFGYCSSDSGCTSISINTDLSSVLSTTIISSSIINKLVPFFIITPIAAALTFISILFNVLALIFANRADGFNTKVYWAFALLISILAFLTSAFICIITFLIYYPYVQWLAWCLIPTAAINLGSVITLAFSFNYLTTSIDDEEEDDNNSSLQNDNSEKFSNLDNDRAMDNSIFNNNTTNFNALSNDIPQIEKSNNLNFMAHSVNSSASSLFTRDNDKTGDLLVTTEKVNTQNSGASLKVPNISDPYNTNNAQGSNVSFLNDDENQTVALNPDTRLSDNENNSANSFSSNFTSISQRPINPNYYAGAPPNRQPMNNNYPNQQYPQYFNQQQQPYKQNMTPQQYHQQRQYNQFQNQMSGMPMQNNNYNNNNQMRKPKPYMMMGQKPNFQNQPPQQQPNYQNYNNNGGNNQQFHQMNPYAPKNPQQRSNGFVPMKYRNRNNMSNLPSTALPKDGPYSGFR